MSYTSSSSGGYLSSILSLLNILPPQYLYLSSVLLIAVSVFLIFYGFRAWEALMISIGAYYGFVFALYISTLVNFGNMPLYLILLIGAVIGGIVFRALVKYAISIFFAIIAFMIAASAYPGNLSMAVLAALVAFTASYFAYKRITSLLSAILGALLLWFGLTAVGINTVMAQVVAGILMVSGIYLQITEKRRKEEKTKRQSGPPGSWRKNTAYRTARIKGNRIILVDDEPNWDLY